MTSKHIYSLISLVILLIFGWISTTAANITCFNPKTQCIEPEGTRHFAGGAPLTLDCWRYKTTFECRAKSDNSCEVLRKQGCTQTKAQCRTMVAGSCVVQDETYSCPIEQCDKAGDIVCGKKPFCVGETCFITTPTKNQNFDRAASALAALDAVGREVRAQNTKDPQLFRGVPMECSKNIASDITKDCCGLESSGLLEGSILQCAEDEEELAKKKAAGLAIEIGEYCYNEVLGLCTSHHKVYCVFDSKIARIIQNDGRKNQLGISFGEIGDDYAHPDCRGITKEELTKMDFSKMDFSDIYSDIRNNVTENFTNTSSFGKKITSYTAADLHTKHSQANISTSSSQVTHQVAGRLQEFYERSNK